MVEISTDLKKNIQEFIESAEKDVNEKRYNPAISSYFKAIAIMCDWAIYRERALLPKNHNERFLFLQLHFKEAYEIINPLFKKYTDSYNIRIQREEVLELKENVGKLRKILKIEE